MASAPTQSTSALSIIVLARNDSAEAARALRLLSDVGLPATLAGYGELSEVTPGTCVVLVDGPSVAESLTHLTALEPACEVLVLTEDADPGRIDELARLGAGDVLVLPGDRPRLRSALILAKARSDRALATASENSESAARAATIRQMLELVVAENERKLAHENALAECSTALLKSRDQRQIKAALRALLAAVDATSLFVEMNVLDPDLGLCSTMVQEVTLPGFEMDVEYWSKMPWSRMPDSYAVLSSGEPFPVRFEELSATERKVYEELGTDPQSELDVPIFIAGEWAGLIGLSDTTRDRQWSDEEVDLLRRAAELIGSFWERQRAEDRLEEAAAITETRLRYEHAIATCSRALLLLGEDDALDTALTAMTEATGSGKGFVERNVDDPELGPCSTMVASHSTDADAVAHEEWERYWAYVPWSKMPDTYSRLSAGVPFMFTLDDLGPVERAVYEGSNDAVRTEINIPIRVDGEWAGLIGFADSSMDRTWTDADIALLETAADMIGTYWARRAAQQQLERLIASKNEFLAAVSHELRTPLTSVYGLAVELRDHFDDFTPEDVDELHGIVTSQAREMSSIVEDLLIAARADAGSIYLDRRSLDVAAEVAAVVGALPEPLKGSVSNNCDGVVVTADPTRLRQILRNLLTNADRYGGTEVVVEASTHNKVGLIRVEDDGPGIGDEAAELVFEPYYRAHDVGGQPASVGLGLTVSRQLARLMGGDVTYRRDEGKSTFELSLPAGD